MTAQKSETEPPAHLVQIPARGAPSRRPRTNDPRGALCDTEGQEEEPASGRWRRLSCGRRDLALIFSNTSARLPGNTGSGGVNLSPGQQEQRELAQAAVLEQQGQLIEALQIYEQVLTQDPGNPGALSEAGWLEFEAGVSGGDEKSLEQGESQEQSAVSIDPGLPSARAFLGSMYFVEGEMAEAVVQYSQFLADKPTVSEMGPFLPDIRTAFSKTRTPLPAIARSGYVARG